MPAPFPRVARARLALAAAVALPLALLPAAPAAASPSDCTQASANAPMLVDADCVDPQYAHPVIDSETDETSPVAHHLVTGHFEGTNITFHIYLHPAAERARWDGRFFQSTYPVTFSPAEDTSRASDRAIGFALANGAYAVQAGNTSFALGYRHDAAAAKFAETVAAAWYGSNRDISGYLYGASGGSFQTVGAAENTEDVWQGFVPVVQAVPTPNSYNFNGRSAAELILADKADAIKDALMPGGSGDPYATLDEAERTMLTEVHALGIPWQAWENPGYLLGLDAQYYGAGLDSDAPLTYDPTYVDDFWNAPGYLGTDQTPLGARVRAELAEMGDTLGHRWNIAKRFAYRYQLPAAGTGWVALDQFRQADGTPLYPQRPVGEPDFSRTVSGNAAFDGSIEGKMIVVSNLYDTDALPLHADWYRSRVEAALGAAADDSYRLYYTDHADHQGPPIGERAKYLIDPTGTVERALLAVAHWAEDGVAAPASTDYEITAGQVVVADSAKKRAGIQPTVEFVSDRVITAKVGQSVPLIAQARTPGEGGTITSVEWDFEGDGTYVASEPKNPKVTTTVKATHRFTAPGTYFVAVKVTATTSGTPAGFAGVQNLDRVRVIVTG